MTPCGVASRPRLAAVAGSWANRSNQMVRADVRAGRLDAEVVEAVLGAAGHRVSRRREGPAGLTPREVEVLILLARGLSNKEIARQLVISPKTAGNHIEHVASTQPPGIIACMFLAITASPVRSSSLGLNWTSSLPASASGMWPGGR